jgi:hypothetical protein
MQPSGRVRRNPLRGVGRDGPDTPRVRRGRAFPLGVEHGWAAPKGSGEAEPVPRGLGEMEPTSLGSVEAGLPLWLVRTGPHTKGSARFVITFLIY